MNGFDRVVEGEENWFHGHRSLPPTPEQYTTSLRFELQKLKDAISIAICAPSIRPYLSISSRGCSVTCRRASLTSFRGYDPGAANSAGKVVCRPDTHSGCGGD